MLPMPLSPLEPAGYLLFGDAGGEVETGVLATEIPVLPRGSPLALTGTKTGHHLVTVVHLPGVCEPKPWLYPSFHTRIWYGCLLTMNPSGGLISPQELHAPLCSRLYSCALCPVEVTLPGDRMDMGDAMAELGFRPPAETKMAGIEEEGSGGWLSCSCGCEGRGEMGMDEA